MSTGPDMRMVTIRLFSSDVEELKKFYPDAGYNKIIRLLVRRHVNQLRQRSAEYIRQQELQADDTEVSRSKLESKQKKEAPSNE